MTDTGPSHRLQRALQFLSHPYAVLLLAALAVWVPQGFNIGPVDDGWVHMGVGWFRKDPSRVFGNLPIHTGMMLTPDSFVGIQLIILAVMLLHAVCFYEIVKRLLPGRALIALAAGLIALVHGADRSYFWVGDMGLQFGLATALGSALCAILYLDQGRPRDLAAALLLQMISVLTYPAFIPLILGIPIGAWLLQRFRGARAAVSFLPKISLLLVAACSLYAYLLHTETGRNAQAADPHLMAALSGYLWALHSLLDPLSEPLNLHLGYFLPALLVTALAFPAAASAAGRDSSRPAETVGGLRYLGVVVAGLLLLALASYLPYSVSNVRYSDSRTMLMCGVFAYTALAVVVLAWLQPRVHKAVPVLLVMALAGYTVMVGQYQRDTWIRPYRAEEKLLAAIAANVPRPFPGTVFLVNLHERSQGKEIDGFYNREAGFSLALERMYGDPTLIGGFYGFGADQVRLDADGVRKRGFGHTVGPLERYPSLILVDYPVDGNASVLGTDWLKQQAGPNASAAAGYTPRFGTTPSADAITCQTLEPGLRPDYCH